MNKDTEENLLSIVAQQEVALAVLTNRVDSLSSALRALIRATTLMNKEIDNLNISCATISIEMANHLLEHKKGRHGKATEEA